MDIKLRARLTAYAKVETFERAPEDHICDLKPISKESIDELFKDDASTDGTDVETRPTSGKSFIDSLF